MDNIHKLKEESFILAQFVEILVHSLMPPTQGNMVEGNHRGETVDGRTGGKQAVVLILPFTSVLFRIEACLLVPPRPRVDLSIIHTQDCAKPISGLM